MLVYVFSEIDMVNELCLFSDKCSNKDYEKMEAEFDKDLSHRRGSFRFGLSKFIVKGENKGDEKAVEEANDKASDSDEDGKEQVNTETIIS
jgi:uncharacterized protein (UPF0210 family)